jgi:hypothetical protein
MPHGKHGNYISNLNRVAFTLRRDYLLKLQNKLNMFYFSFVEPWDRGAEPHYKQGLEIIILCDVL